MEFSVEVPMVNRAAVDYLLSRGCKLESFFEFFMAEFAVWKVRELHSHQSAVFCIKLVISKSFKRVAFFLTISLLAMYSNDNSMVYS